MRISCLDWERFFKKLLNYLLGTFDDNQLTCKAWKRSSVIGSFLLTFLTSTETGGWTDTEGLTGFGVEGGLTCIRNESLKITYFKFFNGPKKVTKQFRQVQISLYQLWRPFYIWFQNTVLLKFFPTPFFEILEVDFQKGIQKRKTS